MWTVLEMYRPTSDPAAFSNKKSKIKKRQNRSNEIKTNPNHGDALFSWYYGVSSTDIVLVCAVVQSGETFLKSSCCKRLLKTLGWMREHYGMKISCGGCHGFRSHWLSSLCQYNISITMLKNYFTQKNIHLTCRTDTLLWTRSRIADVP